MRYLVVVEEGPTSFGRMCPICPAALPWLKPAMKCSLSSKRPSNFISKVCGMRESRYPILTCQANSWTFKLPDPALVRDGTNRGGCRSFIRWGAAGPPW